MLYQQYAFPKKVYVAILALGLFYRRFKAGDAAAGEAEDIEEVVLKALRLPPIQRFPDCLRNYTPRGGGIGGNGARGALGGYGAILMDVLKRLGNLKKLREKFQRKRGRGRGQSEESEFTLWTSSDIFGLPTDSSMPRDFHCATRSGEAMLE